MGRLLKQMVVEISGVVLVLSLHPREEHPFPWSHYRIDWKLRRRRLADLTFREMLMLLPPGVRTIAQVVDLLTCSQMAKMLCAIPVLYPILAELKVEQIIDEYCPTEAEVSLGTVIVILCLNRLVSPKPLSQVADWAANMAIEELIGVPARKLNDDRLGRTLDAIYPHLEDLWAEIVSQALVLYEIDLGVIFYDLTTFYFEGAYRQNQAIVLGYNRTHKGKKQRKLALNVTAREKFPFLYQLLDGNVADVSTVQENMQRLLKALKNRGWSTDQVLVVGDRAMLSAQIVQAYHQANLKYLGALKVMGEPEEALIRGVSEAELQSHALDKDHYGVERAYTFEIKDEGWSTTDRAMIILSRELRRKKRKKRTRHIRERLATLEVIATQRLNQRKYKRRTYAYEQIQKQVLNRMGGEFINLTLDGQDGALQLVWEIDCQALREAMILDGKFILVTNHPNLSSVDMMARYGEKDKVEKGFRTLKGPIRLRPIFLHKEERIAGLVFVNMLALMVYSIVETKCHRAGLIITTEAVLKRFAYLAIIYTTFIDGSVQIRIEPLNPRQQQIVLALEQTWWMMDPVTSSTPQTPTWDWRPPDKLPLPVAN
jgi:transposase